MKTRRLWLRTLALLTLLALVSLAAGWWWLRAQLADHVPDFDQVVAGWASSETRVVSREGVVLQRLRRNDRVRQGQWLVLTDVSPALHDALLFSEDRRFTQHHGVDWRAVLAAAWSQVWHARSRGASTLTMQLAGLLEIPGTGRGGRSVTQKLWQMVAAQRLEERWRKEQILEAYLNLVPFRGELVGVDAMARTLFGKAAHGLDRTDAALAVALIRAPNAAPARVAQRACALLAAQDALAASGAPAVTTDCATLAALARLHLVAQRWAASTGSAPHLARRVLRDATLHATPHAAAQHASAPTTLATTLSAPLQDYANRSLQQHLRELRAYQVEDGAVLVLDNASGAVLAWVGSSGELSAAAEVDAVTAPRQPGSTLKPFLYAQAIAENRLTAASLVDDSAANILAGGGLYVPQNYDHRFQGWVSVRTALAASLNVPAVRTLVMVTPDAFFAQLQKLGLALAQTGGYHGYSLALGSAEVSLLNLTNAYRALANDGRYTPVHWTPRTASESTPIQTVQAIDARAAFIVADILADNTARAPTFGLDSVLATPFWSAVKTGTSKDMRDNWAVGWSQRYTVGVWVGNANGAPMHAVSGTDGAAPVWADVMRYLHRDAPDCTLACAPSLAPPAPPGLVRQTVHFGANASGPPLEAPRHEWFVAGSEQARFAVPTLTHDAALRIAQPAGGTIFALDPDIPPAHQRVRLSARSLGHAATDTALRWRISRSGSTQAPTLLDGPHADWLPQPGRHHIELLDAHGTVHDTVWVEVRGAALLQVTNPHPPAQRIGESDGLGLLQVGQGQDPF